LPSIQRKVFGVIAMRAMTKMSDWVHLRRQRIQIYWKPRQLASNIHRKPVCPLWLKVLQKAFGGILVLLKPPNIGTGSKRETYSRS